MAQVTQIGTHATTVATDEGITRVTYHATAVVKWSPRESWVELNSGGWRTVTTKTRINQALHQFGIAFQVYQRDFDWYVKGTADNDMSDPIPFYDGMVINYS